MKPDLTNDPPEDWQDEVMSEVRANREAYAARFGNDVRAISEHARERAVACGWEVKERTPKRMAVPGSA